MPSRIDEAGHTKAFDYPVAEHWRESRNVQFLGCDSNRQHIGPESNALPTEPPRPPPPEDHITPGPQQGDLLPPGGIVSKEQPRHEKAIPMGPSRLETIQIETAAKAVTGNDPRYSDCVAPLQSPTDLTLDLVNLS